jgi:hypothetical protein
MGKWHRLIITVVPLIRMGEWLFGVKEPVPFSMQPFSESLFGALALYSSALSRAVVAWLLLFPVATVVCYYIFLVTLRPCLKAHEQKVVA